MFAILLPVKQFARSKQRLSGWLAAREREMLARVMFEDVWETLRLAFPPDRLLVISAEPEVVSRCRADRIRCRAEAEPLSHSQSVIEATAWAMSLGVSSLLSVPIDTPAVKPEEIVKLSDLARRYSVVVAPSANGTGTNALLRTPPDAIRPRFGPGSCALHVAEARSKGLSHLVFPVPSLAADIDTPEEAAQFLSLERPSRRGGRTAALLQQWFEAGLETRRGVAVCS